jgi:hypothetical protein
MPDGPAGMTAAAAAERQRMNEEEEMTAYSQEDLKDWEFKIVRANTGVFGKPAEFTKLIQEEARAGWVLVEKFDNSRVRFKRPVSARESDAQLPPEVDPYRTHYGMPALRFVLLILLIIFLGVCGAWTLTLTLFSLLRTSLLSS